jgi:hypothetical protein
VVLRDQFRTAERELHGLSAGHLCRLNGVR